MEGKLKRLKETGKSTNCL